MVATSRLYVTVSYGSCMVAASDLYSTVSWRSCADAECNVYVPWVYHLAAKQGCTDVRVWLPKLGGLNIFCAHVSRGYLWASPIFLFYFLIILCRRWESNQRYVTDRVLLYKNIYSRNLARFARGVLIHAPGLSMGSESYLACACERDRHPRAVG